MSEQIELDELLAIDQLCCALETAWLPPDLPEITVWAYTPTPLSLLIPAMRVIGPPNNRHWLDLGCGTGRNLRFLQLRGWKVSGVELRPQYAALARHLCPGASIVEADITKLSRFDTDVLMCYRPYISDENTEALEQHIKKHTKPGTIAFLPQRPQSNIGTPLGECVFRID
jgi:SAM-dependent methyltransferase